MDDKEKSLLDSFADTIKRTFDMASEAASKALDHEPLKQDEGSNVVPAPGEPLVSDPVPPVVTIVKKKARKKSSVDTSGRITPDYDTLLPDTAMPSPKKAARKISKKSPGKAAKQSVPKATKTVAKKSKKAVKKPASSKTVAKKQRRSVVQKKKKAKRG